MSEENLYKPGEAFLAANVTRGEASAWYTRGLMATDPAFPATRSARLYSRRNILELAVLKKLVSGDIRCDHVYASEILGELCDRIEAGEQVFMLTEQGIESGFDPSCQHFGLIFKAPHIDLG